MRILDFLHAESGAVTVDWVVLAAAVVGLGVGAAIDASLSNDAVALPSLPFLSQYLPKHVADDRAAVYAASSSDQLGG